jgi:hypothetical protein
MNYSPHRSHSALYGDECRRLKDEGLNYTQIATRLGLNDKTVRFVLADETERERIRAQKRKNRQKRTYYGYHHSPLPAPKPIKPTPPVAITKEVKDAAIMAFHLHEIDRHELMRRITPRDKWRGANMGEP